MTNSQGKPPHQITLSEQEVLGLAASAILVCYNTLPVKHSELKLEVDTVVSGLMSALDISPQRLMKIATDLLDATGLQMPPNYPFV